MGGWTPDSAHVINLPRRPDRLAAFTARAAALPFPVAVQPGVEPLGVPDGWGAGPAAWGCALAHRSILRRTEGTALIFEDDAVLPEHLGALLTAAVPLLPAGWDALLLGAGALHHTESVIAGGVQLRGVGAFTQTHAYLVSARGRGQALSAIARSVRNWDHQLGRILGARARTWIIDPPPVIQDPLLGSDISGGGISGGGGGRG